MLFTLRAAVDVLGAVTRNARPTGFIVARRSVLDESSWTTTMPSELVALVAGAVSGHTPAPTLLRRSLGRGLAHHLVDGVDRPLQLFPDGLVHELLPLDGPLPLEHGRHHLDRHVRPVRVVVRTCCCRRSSQWRHKKFSTKFSRRAGCWLRPSGEEPESAFKRLQPTHPIRSLRTHEKLTQRSAAQRTCHLDLDRVQRVPDLALAGVHH
jgi:hypothetical protein